MPESRRPRATSRKRVAGQRNRPETKSNRPSRVGLTRPGDTPEQEEQVDGTAEAVQTAAGAEAAGEDSPASPDQTREDESADSADAAAEAVRTTPDSAGTESSQDADVSDESIAETAQTRNSAAAATGPRDDRSAASTVASRSGTDQSVESQSASSEPATAETATSQSAASESTASESTAIWRPGTPTTEQSEQDAGQRVQAGPKRSALPLVAAGFVAAFVLACLAVWFGVETYRSSAATANEALVDQAATSEVNGQMSDAAAKIFSYDFADTGKSEQAAKNLLEGDAIKEYEQLFATVKQQAPAQKLVVTTTVKASSVLRLEGDRAEVLLFVDQNATRTDNGQNQVGPAQVVFNAKKHGDQWKVTHISQK